MNLSLLFTIMYLFNWRVRDSSHTWLVRATRTQTLFLVTLVTEQPPRVTTLDVVGGEPEARSGEEHTGMVMTIFLHSLFSGNATRAQPAFRHCTSDPRMELVGRGTASQEG